MTKHNDSLMVCNPLSRDNNKETVQSVLRALASQEGCDGEPYDQMIYAADRIDYLEAEIECMKKHENMSDERFDFNQVLMMAQSKNIHVPSQTSLLLLGAFGIVAIMYAIYISTDWSTILH